MLRRVCASAPRSLRSALQPCSTRGYHKNVVDHYEQPRNVGSFDKADPNVGTGLVGAPACGDVMKLQIKARTTLRNQTTPPRLSGQACATGWHRTMAWRSP